jgi:hypothetical protein
MKINISKNHWKHQKNNNLDFPQPKINFNKFSETIFIKTLRQVYSWKISNFSETYSLVSKNSFSWILAK